MAWNPETYLDFGSHRTRPAAELLARIDLPTPARVVDLGCGPGNSTALLAARWPQARVEGVDSSAEMLEAAAKTPSRAQWIQADINQWQPKAPYDVVFSNATLQWLQDHDTLIPRLLQATAPGGTFAAQLPRNFDAPCHTLIKDVARGEPWASRFDHVRDWWNVLEPPAYYNLLAPHATRIDIWETTYTQVLNGPDAVFRWMSGTGLRPFAAAIEGADRDTFLEKYRAALAHAYPQRPEGVTLYPFKRLFMVATRKGK